MKRLTINKAWELCLEQWKWIAKQVKAKDNRRDVDDLKRIWCKKKGWEKKKIHNICFFCEYADQHPIEEDGCNCPAAKIDKTFDCMDSKYHFFGKPLRFYAKLKELNKKRIEK